jgi:hypothetical protein
MRTGSWEWQVVVGPHMPSVHLDIRRRCNHPLAIVTIMFAVMLGVGLLLVALMGG